MPIKTRKMKSYAIELPLSTRKRSSIDVISAIFFATTSVATVAADKDTEGEQRGEREGGFPRSRRKFSPLFIGLLHALRFQRRPVISPGEFSEKSLQKGTYESEDGVGFRSAAPPSTYTFYCQLPFVSLWRRVFPPRHRVAHGCAFS